MDPAAAHVRHSPAIGAGGVADDRAARVHAAPQDADRTVFRADPAHAEGADADERAAGPGGERHHGCDGDENSWSDRQWSARPEEADRTAKARLCEIRS